VILLHCDRADALGIKLEVAVVPTFPGVPIDESVLLDKAFELEINRPVKCGIAKPRRPKIIQAISVPA
jgi:hypothetical protein